MNKLQCPYCDQKLCIEIETIKILNYTIKERIEIVGADGTQGSPTFVLAPALEIPNTRKTIIVKCTNCSRRFYEISRNAEIDVEKLQVILENFSETIFTSYDVAIKIPEQRKFILKQRPREPCTI